MISSAVVIPEQPPPVEEEVPSPSLKRRQSSQSTETNKRPRLDSTNGSLSHGSPPPPSAMSPPRRKSSLFTGTEEKKRGQRLFGALLGTLSQTSSKPTHRKRDEIEKRQQERLRRDDEEREEERRRKKEELDQSRRAEQKIWDRESAKLRYRNMRATASFLRTKTEPRLHYKPWELRSEEEEQIKQQIEEVEAEIRKEQVHDADQLLTPANDVEPKQHVKDEPVDEGRDAVMQNGADSYEPDGKKELESETGDSGDSDDRQTQPAAEPSEAQLAKTEHEQEVAPEEKPKEEDQGGEELVEGHEDQVIY